MARFKMDTVLCTGMCLWANIQSFTVQSGCVFKLSCCAKQNLLVGRFTSELN